MVALLIILILVVSFLIWVIIAPINLTIDTRTDTYQLMMPGVMGVKFIPDSNQILIARIVVLFIPFKLGLMNMLQRSHRKKTRRNVKPDKKRSERNLPQKSRSRGPGISPRKFIRLLRTFKIKELRLLLDSGDAIWNGLLTPTFYWLSGKNRSFIINYTEQNEFTLRVQNRLSRILYALLS